MKDYTPIIVSIVTVIPGIIVGVATLIQAKKTHNSCNSKMDKLLKLTADSSFAAGKKAEKDKRSPAP